MALSIFRTLILGSLDNQNLTRDTHFSRVSFDKGLSGMRRQVRMVQRGRVNDGIYPSPSHHLENSGSIRDTHYVLCPLSSNKIDANRLVAY